MHNSINVNCPTVLIDVSASSQRVALPYNATLNMLVTNGATGAVFIKTGDSTVTAAVTDFPVLAGAIEDLSKQQAHTHVAAISTGTLGKIYFTAGEE